jgi:hypothetical protein
VRIGPDIIVIGLRTLISQGSAQRACRTLMRVNDVGRDGTSASGVRRGKASLSSGCETRPATAPAGSNRSIYGGNEMAEAFGSGRAGLRVWNLPLPLCVIYRVDIGRLQSAAASILLPLLSSHPSCRAWRRLPSGGLLRPVTEPGDASRADR